MPVFKNEDNGTWYVMARYVNWKGERKQKCKRGFATKKEAQLILFRMFRQGFDTQLLNFSLTFGIITNPYRYFFTVYRVYCI